MIIFDYFRRFCGSKNYPYLLHGRGFCLDSHPNLSENSSQASYIYLQFWAFENPHPPLPGLSNAFSGGSMNIFWNYTLNIY